METKELMDILKLAAQINTADDDKPDRERPSVTAVMDGRHLTLKLDIYPMGYDRRISHGMYHYMFDLRNSTGNTDAMQEAILIMQTICKDNGYYDETASIYGGDLS